MITTLVRFLRRLACGKFPIVPVRAEVNRANRFSAEPIECERFFLLRKLHALGFPIEAPFFQ